MIKRITSLLFFAFFLNIQISKAQTIISDSPDTICLGQLVTFTLTGSSGQCQKWYFTDLFNTYDGEDTVVSYTFNYSGAYSVQVTDHIGASTNCSNPIDTYYKDIYVVDTAAPYVNAYPLSTCPNSPIGFYMSYNLAGYHWDFGDGTTSTEQSPSHEFSLPVGTKTIQAIFFRPCGNDTIYTYIDIIDTLKPITYSSDFYLYNSNDTLLCPNTPFQFYFNGAHNTDYKDFRIYFGDGDSSANQSVYHSYTDTGYFHPTVVVWNGCGNTDTIEFNDYNGIVAIHVTNGLTVSPSLYSGDLSVVNPNTYLECPFTSIKCTLNNSPFPIERYSYYWNFGDGGTSSQKDPVYSYTATGSYSPTLTVTNGCGNSSSGVFTTPIVITNTIIPSPLFAGEFYNNIYNSICSGTTAQFTYDSSNHSDYTWKWYFDDGDSSILANPTHAYTSTLVYASFDPFLRIYNGCGNHYDNYPNSIQLDSTVTVSTDGIGTNMLNQDTICKGDPIKFYLIGPDPATTLFRWDFGNGDTSNLAMPTYSFPNSGTYTIQVTASNTCGSSGTEIYHAIEVIGSGGPPPIVDDFDFHPIHSCIYDSVSFVPTYTSYFDYHWHFGDGNSSHLASPKHPFQSAISYYSPYLIVTNACGASATAYPPTAQQYGFAEDWKIVDAGLNKKINAGNSVMLTPKILPAPSFMCEPNYLWYPATGLDANNIKRPIAKPLVTTIYHLILTDNPGLSCDKANCYNEDSVIVTVQNTLAGTIYRNNYIDTVKAGRVFLVEYDITNQVLMPTVDTATINPDGTYSFGYIDQGDYFLIADAATSMYPDAALTYYGDTVDWRYATIYNHITNTSLVNINVKEYIPPVSGIGRIAGTVMEGQNYGKMMSAGQPVKGISVGLNKSPGGVVQMTISDTSSGSNKGKFEFRNLSSGFYKLFANVTGVPLDVSFPSTTFSISVTDSTDLNVGIYVDSNLISLTANIYAGIPSPKDGEGIIVSKIYPNPASDHLDIELDNYTQKNSRSNLISFHFYDIRGKKIESLNPFELQRGHSVIRINTSGLMNGIYMLGIEQTDEEGRSFVKIASKVVIVK